MNENTRVVVCCYAGDCCQVIRALDVYLHHNCPVVVLSPEDSKADVRYPGVEQRFAGKRAYVGPDSLERQRLHFLELLKFPEQHFLIHDSDSVCLSPDIPRYLYEEPDLVWSNLVNDDIPEHQEAYPDGFPHIAMQPPYFLSRKTIEALVSVAGGIVANPTMPFIDHYYVQLAVASGLSYRGFPDGASCSTDLSLPCGEQILSKLVREDGHVFLHSIKRREVLSRLLGDRQEYLRTRKS